MVFAVFEPIKHELALSDHELGWLGSAYVVVLSLAALPLGVVGDLRSRRTVITFGVTLWSLCTALGGAVRRFWQLLGCRALVGVGEAGYGPAAQALVAEYFRGRRRAFALGVYSVGMSLGGVLGIWLGGALSERYGWRMAFVAMGVPGLVLALLASRLREPARRGAAPLRLVAAGYVPGRRRLGAALAAARPLVWLGLAGAVASAALSQLRRVSAGLETAVFAASVSAGIVWTVVRLVPLAVGATGAATEVAATALGEFLQAAATVLRTPTLIWMFGGGALVTFAANGLIAWAPSFMARVHGVSVAALGRQLGLWGVSAAALGGLFGGRVGDWLLARWSGGRVLVSGAGFVLGGPVCAALLLIDELRLFAPLLVATFFLYSWYNGPFSAVIIDVVPTAVRASVLGAYVLFSHLAGDAIAPPLIGYLSDHFGLRPAMLLLPGAGAVGGLAILIALTTVRQDMLRVQAA